MAQCQWKIRPFPNDTEIQCDVEEHKEADGHSATLYDYAYPGSKTEITWYSGDRREYSGEWPGKCSAAGGCILPLGHRGNHAP